MELLSIRLDISEGTVLEIVQGDISRQSVDVIVNAANDHLWMGGGVAGALKKVGGEEIEREAMDKGPVAVGDAVFTSAGRLKARYVIHAAVMGQDLRTDEESIMTATRSALRLAKELRARSVAIPALGTGVGGFPIERAAEIMTEVIQEETAPSGSGLEVVRVVLYDSEACSRFLRASKEWLERRSRGVKS